MGNLGDLVNLDLGHLQQYLPNLNFPASKEEMVDRIRNSGKGTFNSADEVLRAVRGRL